MKQHIEIDWDIDTRNLLHDIISSSIELAHFSGFPIDKKHYESIEKIKILANWSGKVVIEEIGNSWPTDAATPS